MAAPSTPSPAHLFRSSWWRLDLRCTPLSPPRITSAHSRFLFVWSLLAAAATTVTMTHAVAAASSPAEKGSSGSGNNAELTPDYLCSVFRMFDVPNTHHIDDGTPLYEDDVGDVEEHWDCDLAPWHTSDDGADPHAHACPADESTPCGPLSAVTEHCRALIGEDQARLAAEEEGASSSSSALDGTNCLRGCVRFVSWDEDKFGCCPSSVCEDDFDDSEREAWIAMHQMGDGMVDEL